MNFAALIVGTTVMSGGLLALPMLTILALANAQSAWNAATRLR